MFHTDAGVEGGKTILKQSIVTREGRGTDYHFAVFAPEFDDRYGIFFGMSM
jgi:hypothetical protein